MSELRNSYVPEYCFELIKCGLQIVDDLLGDDVGVRKTGGIFKALVLEPENVDVDLVALEQFIVAERFELFRLLPFVPVLGIKTRDEIIKIAALEGGSL